MVIGYNPGGGYDIYSRIIATSLPRYVPGSPTIISRNMPGVGSAVAANYLAGPAPCDDLTIGMIGQQLSLAQALNDPIVKFNLRQFNWLGRVASNVEVTVAWHTSPVKNLADTIDHELPLAATSAGSTSHSMPLLISCITVAKFKLVTGYPSITGGVRAMECGETQGTHATVDGLLFAKRDWLSKGKISVLVQDVMERHPVLPNAPAMTEFARSEEDRVILNLFASPTEIGRCVVYPPGDPAERVEMWRNAFSRMLVDPAFEAEFKSKGTVSNCADIAGLVRQIYRLGAGSIRYGARDMR